MAELTHFYQGIIWLHAKQKTNHLHIVILKCGVINDNDPVGTVNSNAIHPDAAGHQQAVVGVELTELALPDGQIHHDSSANWLVEILPDEGKHGSSAHTGRAFKDKVAVRPGAKVQSDSFRAEHRFRFLLAVNIFLLPAGVVKDSGEVHIEKDLGQIGDNLSICRECKVSAMQLVHDLIEQGIVILLYLGAGSAFLRSWVVQVERIDPLGSFLCISHHRSGRESMDFILD